MNQKIKEKAVGLISGGLDSLLASKILINMGIEVHGIHFLMPFDHEPNKKLQKIADGLDIIYHEIQLDNDYILMLQNPKSGYGTAFNPCIDCHAYMIQKASQFMKKIGACCVFTGEVMGQRPLSQNKVALTKVVKTSGLQGRVLRPLSAHLLEPTIPEQEGLIDRSKLLGISGRSRKEQIALAKEFNITDYPQPAGGCLLTDKNYSLRLKDLLAHGYTDYKQTVMLKWGRHFRINENFKAIVGRDSKENELLNQYAEPTDYIMHLEGKNGPLLILQGPNPQEDILSTAGGLIQRFSKHKDESNLKVRYWRADSPQKVHLVSANILQEDTVQKMRV